MTTPHAVIALGGGYGHACRVAAARHTLAARGLLGAGACDVLVSDPHLPPALVPGARLWSPPQDLRRDAAGLGVWIAGWLADRSPGLVWVDAFPAGVLGELWPGLAPDALWELLARRLRWDRYAATRRVRLPAYDRVWVTEPLDDGELAALAGTDLHPLELVDPPLDPGPARAVVLPGRCRLVVHSGPVEETLLLVEAALEPGDGLPVVVAAPGRPRVLPRGVVGWEHVVPAAPLADRPEVVGVVTAGGASSVRQYAHLGARHRVRPLPRALDDQHERAGRRICQVAD
ncbi:hypothetical protein GCM10027418_17520 [Mariniluteicoccus endophyticus]